MEVRVCSSPADFRSIAILFKEYQMYLSQECNVELCLTEEASNLSSHFSLFLLALDPSSQEPLGMVCLRPLVSISNSESNCCEMKRLFVRSSARGLGIGSQLLLRLFAEARRLGMTTIKLDTMPMMKSAIKLYQQHVSSRHRLSGVVAPRTRSISN